MLTPADIPAGVNDALGSSHASRINTLIIDLIDNSRIDDDTPLIAMSDERRQVANELRGFLFERVYDPINRLEQTKQAGEMVKRLFAWYLDHPGELPSTIQHLPGEPPERRVADAVASMTDRYAIELHERIAPHQILVP
jgi:dGTPase